MQFHGVDVPRQFKRMRELAPEPFRAWLEFDKKAFQAGAIDKKTKELIALCIGVAGHCDACIAFHVKALVKLDATRSEIEEALGVAVYMGGGPSLMYAADAMAAFEQLSLVSMPAAQVA